MASPNKTILTGGPGAWLRKVSVSSSGVVTMGTPIYGFANITAPGVKGVRPEGAASADEYIDVGRCDGAIFKFLKKKLEIDPLTNTAMAGGAGGGSGSKGGIRYTLNEGKFVPAVEDPETPATAEMVTKLFYELEPELGSTFLAGVHLGFTVDGTSAGVAYVIGTLDADLDYTVDGYAPAKLALSFAGKNLGSLELAELTKLETHGFTAVVPSAGVTYSTSTITPTALAAGDGAKLAAGRLVIKL